MATDQTAHPTDHLELRAEVEFLAQRAGLGNLAPQHLDQMVDAYPYVQAMLSRLRRGRDRGDEPAHAFSAGRFEE